MLHIVISDLNSNYLSRGVWPTSWLLQHNMNWFTRQLVDMFNCKEEVSNVLCVSIQQGLN